MSSFNISPSHDESDSTLKIRTGARRKKRVGLQLQTAVAATTKGASSNSNNMNGSAATNETNSFNNNTSPKHRLHQQKSILSHRSSSSTFRRSSQQQPTLSRRTTMKLDDPTYMISLRRHSFQVAENAWKQLGSSSNNISLGVTNSSISNIENSTYFETYSDDDEGNSSMGNITIETGTSKKAKSPTEIATLRGTKRALRESNEISRIEKTSNVFHPEDIDIDIATIDGTITATSPTNSKTKRLLLHHPFHRVRTLLRGGGAGPSPTKRIVRFQTNTPSITTEQPIFPDTHIQRQEQQRQANIDNATTGSTSNNRNKKHNSTRNCSESTITAAWMCGVCGMIFSSEAIADQHEQKHIAEVVNGMEWNTNKHGKNNDARHPRQQQQPQELKVVSNISPASILMPSSNTLKLENLPETPLLKRPKHDNASNALFSPDSLFAVGTASPVTDTVRFTLSDQNNQTYVTTPKFDDEYPGFEDDIPTYEPSLANDDKRKQQFREQPSRTELDPLFVHSIATERIIFADEALCDVMRKAVPMILSERERDAELELELLARDKVYYDECTKRAIARQANPSNRYRSDREDILAKVQNKFVDAYQLMKESDGKRGITDQYNRINRRGGKEGTTSVLMKHNDNTLYVNVMVKNSVDVVRRELERLAKERWEISSQDESLTRFERFRVYTQMNVVKLAGIALASDFTPRRIAVQLSNDLYRLLTPKLKRRGVTIETEIEYRVGPYFVLAVNIKTIDWWKLIKTTHKVSAQRQVRWEKEHRRKVVDSTTSNADTTTSKMVAFFRDNLDYFQVSFSLSVFDVIERAIALLYYVHWTIYLPICWVAYYILLGPYVRKFILTSVADEIFYYVEQKGMEMQIQVCRTEKQAAFMLSALREIRVDGQELKKKIELSEKREKGFILGPLMGPAIAADKGPAPTIPDGFEIPENLEFIGLELNLSVGFQRLRWALLSDQSSFVTEALYKTEARYEKIEMGKWNKFSEHIGEPKLKDGVSTKDFIGAEKEGQYLMPKSAFVSANMCYETHYILAYNDYCFCLKKRARNPDAPFGKTFLAWTQYLVVNTGNDTCKLTCSVQPEFPHGTPMVSRQITSGMRAGTGELFVLIGATIEKYSDEFP